MRSTIAPGVPSADPIPDGILTFPSKIACGTAHFSAPKRAQSKTQKLKKPRVRKTNAEKCAFPALSTTQKTRKNLRKKMRTRNPPNIRKPLDTVGSPGPPRFRFERNFCAKKAAKHCAKIALHSPEHFGPANSAKKCAFPALSATQKTRSILRKKMRTRNPPNIRKPLDMVRSAGPPRFRFERNFCAKKDAKNSAKTALHSTQKFWDSKQRKKLRVSRALRNAKNEQKFAQKNAHPQPAKHPQTP